MVAIPFQTTRLSATIWLIPALLAYWTLRHIFPDDRTLAQIVALPFFVTALASIVIAGFKFGRRLLFISAAISLLVALSPYLIPRSAQHHVFVEQFAGDALGGRTHIFIEALNESFARLGDLRAVEWRSINSASVAGEQIETQLDEVILRSDEKLMRVQLGPSKSVVLNSDFFPGRLLGAAKLELVTWVPVIALSTQPHQATADFLTSLLSGALPNFNFERGGELLPDQSVLDPNQEMLLWSATMRSDRWRSAAHRALPAWILANRYLVESFRAGSIDPGSLNCALKSYEIAARFMRYGDNPELYAAIKNNHAVAWYLMSLVTGRSEYRSYARKYLGLAVASLKQPNLFRLRYFSGHIARRNLARLGVAGISHGNKSKKRAKLSQSDPLNYITRPRGYAKGRRRR